MGARESEHTAGGAGAGRADLRQAVRGAQRPTRAQSRDPETTTELSLRARRSADCTHVPLGFVYFSAILKKCFKIKDSEEDCGRCFRLTEVHSALPSGP